MHKYFICIPKKLRRFYKYSSTVNTSTVNTSTVKEQIYKPYKSILKSSSFSTYRKEKNEINIQQSLSFNKNDPHNILFIIIHNNKPFISGRFGSLYRNNDYVIKRFKQWKDYEHEKMIYEIMAIKRNTLLIKNVCSYVSFNDDLKCITLIYYGIDLHTYINDNGIMDIKDCKRMCYYINLGLFYINSHGYIYGDLKRENVCLKNDNIFHPVIIDLGSCSKTRPTITMETSSPESLQLKKITYKHDIWTLGILYMECITMCYTKPKLVRDNIYPFYNGSNEEMKKLRNDEFFTNLTCFEPMNRRALFQLNGLNIL